MDFVPSPGFFNPQFAASPHFSIYESDRPEGPMALCGRSANISNPNMEPVEDICGLDDKFEDSTLQAYLTSEVMNSFQSAATAAVPTELSWGSKMDSVDSLDANPTLSQLNMEPDLSIVDDILNIDADNDSALEFLYNELNSSSNNSLDAVTSNFISTSSESKVAVSAANYGQQKTLETLGDKYMRTFVQPRNNFPPRASHPPVVGVVTPVIKKERGPSFMSNVVKSENDLGKLQAQSPCLHKLLKREQSVVQPEVQVFPLEACKTDTHGIEHADKSAQIVPPSSCVQKRTSLNTIKMEPKSPEKTMPRSEESTDERWRDIENYIHNPSPEPPTKKRKRCDSGSSAHTSEDEDDEDDDRSCYGAKDGEDDSDDDYSDIDSDLTHISPLECESLVTMGKKQKQFFWQYNVQSKGPKGTRLKLAVETPSDPHILNDFEDPVFDECNTMVAGIRHGGKARKGDGNEITPNPKKLFMIGHQLLRLNEQINACQLGPDVPVAKRNESKKEKNKLASRACRLKKKAQHEAYKIKLCGLERQHSQYNTLVRCMWSHIREEAKLIMGSADKSATSSSSPASTSGSLKKLMEKCLSEQLHDFVAGNTTDYVNSIILKVESGDKSGGLGPRKSLKT